MGTPFILNAQLLLLRSQAMRCMAYSLSLILYPFVDSLLIILVFRVKVSLVSSRSRLYETSEKLLRHFRYCLM